MLSFSWCTLACIFAHLRVGPEREGSEISYYYWSRINRERGGGTGAFVLLTLVCHGRLLELRKRLSKCKNKDNHGLGEIEKGLKVLASYSPVKSTRESQRCWKGEAEQQHGELNAVARAARRCLL